MAKDFADISRIETAEEMNATNKRESVSKLMKAWESKNAKRALQGAGLTTMAVTLAACGGSDDTTTTTPTTPVTPVVPAAQTFRLTTGVSDVAGPGAGADTIDGSLTAGGLQTWQTTDLINGGDGVDTLNVAIAAGTAYTADTASNLSNVENLVITSNGVGANTVTLGGATFSVTGVQSITNTLSTRALTVDGVNNLVTVNVVNNANATTVVFADTVLAGGNDTVTLNLNGATGNVTIGTATDGDGDYETLVINTSGAASSFAAAGLGADATTMTITGAGDLTLTGAAFANLGTLNAAAATGDISIVLAADTVASATNTKTATFGAGDDTLDISALVATTVGAVAVNMGAGDDTVILGAQGASDYTINGGAGTDSISISVAPAAALHQGVSGFERLIVTDDVALDMVQFTGNTGFTTLRAANDATVNALQTTAFSNVRAGVTTLELATAATGNTPGTHAVALTRLQDGAADSLSVATRAAQTLTTLSIVDEEIVSINSTRGALTLTNFTTTDMTSLTVTGANAVNVGTSSGTSVATVDVSGLSAAFTGVFAASTAAMTVTGNGNVGAGNMIITTGSGNDVITGGRGADQITAGAGNDVISGGRGNDTITLGFGSDTVVFGSTAATNGADTINGFTGGAVVGGGDVLNFASFLSGGSVEQNGGATTTITVFTANTNNDVNITGKVAILEIALGAAATEADVFGEISAAGDSFAITAGGKAIVIIGDDDQGNAARVAFIDTTLTGTTALQVEDIVFVANLGTIDVDTLTTANFAFV